MSDKFKPIPFHLQEYWEDFYKNGALTYDWYVNLENIQTDYFNIDQWDREAEILIIGVGSSSIIDCLIEKKFLHVTLVDYSEQLISKLKQKYESFEECEEWDCT